MVVSRFFADSIVTQVAAQIFTSTYLAPALNPVNDPGGAVIRNYSEYKMRNATYTYTPLVGTTTPGIVWSAYFDNPEVIFKIKTAVYTLGQVSALVQNCPGAVCSPAWQTHEVRASMVSRRKWYTVDSTAPSDQDRADLSVHGLFVTITVSCPLNTAVGVTTVSYAAEGHRLQTAAVSGI